MGCLQVRFVLTLAGVKSISSTVIVLPLSFLPFAFNSSTIARFNLTSTSVVLVLFTTSNTSFFSLTVSIVLEPFNLTSTSPTCVRVPLVPFPLIPVFLNVKAPDNPFNTSLTSRTVHSSPLTILSNAVFVASPTPYSAKSLNAVGAIFLILLTTFPACAAEPANGRREITSKPRFKA